MSSEILRRAAAAMRERAMNNAVPEGRWFVEDDDPEWHVLAEDPDMPAYPFDVARDLPGDDRSPVAEHIASWHPAVALAVAELLESVTETGVSEALLRHWMERDRSGRAALAVARAYLGEE